MAGSSTTQSPILVVGVGASAGGLEAFKNLLWALPVDSGMAFLLVQHLDPDHESLLAELLASHTKMRVTEAEQGLELAPNTVYIIQPDTALAVCDGRIELSAPTLHRGIRLPVDHLFRSLAHDYGWRAAGVVLSGAGSDGCAGLRELRAAGGLSVAQSPETTKQRGMPQSAIDNGVVDLILDIEDIPEALARFAELPEPTRLEPIDGTDARAPEAPRSFDNSALDQLAAVLEARINFDLRVYKPATVERRLLRRMALAGFEDLDAYFEFLREDLPECHNIVRDLLISVTEFYRDPEAFRTLRELVIDPLVGEAEAGAELRVWVPACATGEEAYSVALEFLDAIASRDVRLGLQVFATDIDQDALDIARAGIYPPTIARDVPEPRLRKYFRTLDGRGYQVRSPLRDVVSFANQDLTKDPPFSRMDLVSCRNVLIYLTPDAQRHVLEVLHFALSPGGHLFLSTSETTGPRRELFSTASKPHSIFTKVGSSRHINVSRSRSRPKLDQAELDSSATHRPRPRSRPDDSALARRAVLAAWAPPTVIVAQSGELLFSHGELSPFLHFPQGDNPRLDLGTLLRPHLASRARSALYQARRSGKSVTAVARHDDPDGGQTRITAAPVAKLGDGAVMLSFEPIASAEPRPEPSEGRGPEHDAIIEELEYELQATREDLRNTVEELESSNEELRSSNEESMSMNEELQSANEELEATTEELRSLNEELTTVNTQLREKVSELERAHDDLHNFFASTKIATLFLDDELRIKRFTPAAGALLDLDHGDLGRLASDIARELLQGDLCDAARSVLDQLTPAMRELETSEGRWLSREILPYRTESRRIEGVVVTFVDITELKRATKRLEIRETQQAVIARLGLHALRERSALAFMTTVVSEVQQTLDVEFCKILELQSGGRQLLLRAGVGWHAGLVGAASVEARSSSQAGYTLEATEPVIVEDLSEERRFTAPSLLADHQITSGLSCVVRDGAHHYGVLGVHSRKPRSFTRTDANFLQAVASIVASAVTRSQARTARALELGVARVLDGGQGLDALFGAIVEVFDDELGVAVGELWWVDDEGQSMTRRTLAVVDDSERDAVEASLAQTHLASGEDVVGGVLADTHAAWATNISHPQVSERARLAGEIGLQSGLAFPILLDGEVLGVIGVYAREHLFASHALLLSLEGIGRTVGAYVAKTRLELHERRLAAITASSHDAILSYDVDGRITEWLAGAEQLYGYGAAEMVGQSIERIVPLDRRETQRDLDARVRAGEVVEPLETARRCADGREVMVSVRSSVVRSSSGEVLGIASTERDITQRKQIEHELVLADQQKDEFLAMLGHELRNPLGAIRSAVTLLGPSCANNPELGQAHAVLERQTEHMSTLLDGLLDISRIVRGKIALEIERLDLAEVCREVIADAASRLASRELELRPQLPDAPLIVAADRVRVAQIIDNLLGNAIKYTSDGGRIDIILREDDGYARLEVRDTGIGIEAHLLADIFEVFEQADQSLDRRRGGLGLGLALVKSLTDLHGGSVEVYSAGLNEGATFTICLPLADAARETHDQASASAPDQHAEAPASVSTILIIEDDEDGALMLNELLKSLGYVVEFVHHGVDGIERARTWTPDVILCDLGLPDGVSGYVVAERLRADARTKAKLMIALSGYGRPEDKARALEAGFDHHLTKPVDLAALQQLLAP